MLGRQPGKASVNWYGPLVLPCHFLAHGGEGSRREAGGTVGEAPRGFSRPPPNTLRGVMMSDVTTSQRGARAGSYRSEWRPFAPATPPPKQRVLLAFDSEVRGSSEANGAIPPQLGLRVRMCANCSPSGGSDRRAHAVPVELGPFLAPYRAAGQTHRWTVEWWARQCQALCATALHSSTVLVCALLPVGG